MKNAAFSLARVGAVMIKEAIQLRRDRLTFAMIIGVPIIQLVLFGYAINTDPKQLPTLVIAADQGPVARAIVTGMQNSGYFDVRSVAVSEKEARAELAAGRAAFAVTIPVGFQRDLVRGARPTLVVEADASDPSAASGGVAALPQIVQQALTQEAVGAFDPLRPEAQAVNLVVHKLYNPEGITSYNIVPGLLGTILTLTTILMTALALTREVERGTMENLLAMPSKPLEIMLGKIVPYIIFGLVQVGIVLICARLLFAVPLIGSVTLLLGLTLLFVGANVTLGYTFSSLARNQMQAMQMTFFYFLPSILLSGFMFPFRGMPDWAQWIGQVLPLTHYLRIVRGVMLKGSGLGDLVSDIWPLMAFWLLISAVALARYRRTLD
jgi:ABC-2 type transport system permease protein